MGFPERLNIDIPPMKIAAQVYILLLTHADYYALKVMSQMLSGSVRMYFEKIW